MAGNGTCIFVFEKDQTEVELSRPGLNWYDFDYYTGRYLHDDPMGWLIKKKGNQFKEQLEYIMKTLHLEVSRDDYFGFYCSINY